MNPNSKLIFSETLFVLLASISSTIHGQLCPPGLNLSLVKIPNVAPTTTTQPVLLYANRPGVAITAECYHRCSQSSDCSGFIVDYKQGSCFRVSISRLNVEQFVPYPDANFFEKVCLKVPANCTNKVWPIEHIPGHELVGHQHTVVPGVNSKWSCAQMCLDQYERGNGLPCLSAQYDANSKTCTFSHHSRHTQPDAFTVSTRYSSDYMENQCLHDQERTCWRDAVYNVSSLRADLQIENLRTQEECERRCQSETNFKCRAFSFRCPPDSYQRGTLCSLHSDAVGETSEYLVSTPCSVYKEMITCLDLSVECGANTMVATLNWPGFTGQLFALGHANVCGVQGSGAGNSTQLVIPVPAGDQSQLERNRCGVKVVRSVGAVNRTQASTVIVVQHHKVIQTISDRVVRLSCVLSNSGYSSFSNNITLNASFGVSEPSVQNVITGNGSNILEPANARLSIVDISKGGQPAMETQLGDELQFRIDIDPPYNVSMIRAGHLVASSGTGQDSILLLDWRGCPPDTSVFPALVPAGDHALAATFRAFRFPASPILRFSLVLTFCENVCQPTECGNRVVSYGRRRRAADVLSEMPLQLAIIVREPTALPENATVIPEASRSNEDGIGVFCASYSSAIVVALAIVVGQTVLLIVCCVALARREKQNDQVSLQSDFHPPDDRHITWADQLNSNKLHPPFESPRPQTPLAAISNMSS
ncbi:uncharacterized protein LOC111048518 isoform X2 [Nilaparvata lugens]|uniref:uncharacterized protein LOC111048518 isoform X2 n=1 Tax=Nilaparvata lugens TaxID=108931 RepID=UPI00193CEE82|nr:uncharacterized protein LOC111048518 isoform X2 [Nilaparvata lugens]